MNVDEPALRIDDLTIERDPLVVARFQSVQPKDTRGDKIILGRGPLGGELPRRLTGLKDRARDGASPNLLADLVKPVRGLMRIFDATTAGPGGAHDVGFAILTTYKPEFLLVNRHNDAIFRRRQTEPF